MLRIGDRALHFHWDPDLSTVFEDIFGVLEALAEVRPRVEPLEIYFFEQGTDLALVLEPQNGLLLIRLRAGTEAGARFLGIDAGPFVVSKRDFVESWARFLDAVMQAMAQDTPSLVGDGDFCSRRASLTAAMRAVGADPT